MKGAGEAVGGVPAEAIDLAGGLARGLARLAEILMVGSGWAFGSLVAGAG